VRRDRESVYERLQAGCELVGAPGAEADAEIVGLAAASLKALGLPAARISLGSTGYFEALAKAAGVSERLATALHDAVDRKDLPTLRGLCEREVQPGKARDALLLLAQPPRPRTQAEDLLARARAAAPGEEALAALQRLGEVLQKARGAELEVDLGEVRGLGYYTGVVFNLYAAGAPRPVGGGGRYDTLLGRFGDPRPAVGFSLDLDALVPLAC
jgi:ATP phosphoribosyltransferase regulatory subunit